MKKALVVDNNGFYRKVLRDLLEEESYQVSDAADGISALRCVASERPDLVLLDLVMPKMDGTKVCRHLKADPSLRSIPVVVLSGILLEDMGNLRGIGAEAYVAKMPLDRLLPTLRTVIRRLEEGCDEVLVEGFEGMFRREIVVELLEEKRFRDLVFSSLTEGAAELDTDLRIVSVNPAFAEIVGRVEIDVIDQPIIEVLGLEERMATELFSAESCQDESRNACKVSRDNRLLQLHVSPVARDEEVLGFIVLVEDVTEFWRAEEDREQLRAQLAQTDKLSSLGRMVAGIAHELNNPLTGVLGYTQLLLERAGPDGDRKDLQKILHESKRCQAIVENLLAFSRRAVPLWRTEDLGEITRKALARFEPDFREAGITIECRIPEDLPEAELDGSQWAQVITQLVRNAQQAMGGTDRPGHIRISASYSEERIHVEVKDNGVGITAANLPRIFDPFFTTAGVGEGSGLGLSVVYGIVREHGGRIRASSQEDQGACFTIDLPLTPTGSVRTEAAPVGDDAAVGVNQILVVDDEPVILDLLVDLLEGQGAQVDTALNGVEALEKLGARSYDAVVLDLRMPEMGGREVYEHLAEVAPEMRSRVLFSTGDVVSPEAREFFREVDVPVIQKPFQIEQVTKILARFLSTN